MKPVLLPLCQTIVLQAQYPAAYNPSRGWSALPLLPFVDSDDFEGYGVDKRGSLCARALVPSIFPLQTCLCCMLVHVFVRYRDGHGLASTCLCAAYDVLQGSYFEVLLAMLDESSWQRIEAVLYCIEWAATEVASELSQASGGLSAAFGDTVQRVHSVMQWLLPRLSPAAMPAPLMTSALRLFGTCGPILR